MRLKFAIIAKMTVRLPFKAYKRGGGGGGGGGLLAIHSLHLLPSPAV